MKKTRLKSSLTFTLAMALLTVLPASGKMRHHASAPATVEEAEVFVGSSRTLLPDGRFLVAGGQDSSGRVQATLSITDLVAGTVTILDVGLRFPRAAHTATVLPDGTVLILGGVGQDGALVPSSEVFDPVAGTVNPLTSLAPAARAFHTATLLTDGRLLIAGGVLANGVPETAVAIWDFQGKNSAALPSQVAMDRHNHAAALLPDGRVLFSGGVDSTGNSLTNGQIFDPQSQTVTVVSSLSSQESGNALTEMRASSPLDGAQNVLLDSLISVRFSRPVQMSSVSSTTATLQGPDGIINAKVVAAVTCPQFSFT